MSKKNLRAKKAHFSSDFSYTKSVLIGLFAAIISPVIYFIKRQHDNIDMKDSKHQRYNKNCYKEDVQIDLKGNFYQPGIYYIHEGDIDSLIEKNQKLASITGKNVDDLWDIYSKTYQYGKADISAYSCVDAELLILAENGDYNWGINKFGNKKFSDLSVDLIKSWCRVVNDEVLSSDKKGRCFRDDKVEVKIKGFANNKVAYLPPETTKSLVKKVDTIISKTKDLMHDSCVDAAAYFHIEFVKVHPLYDGNGRTARYFMNKILDECSMKEAYFASNELYTQAVVNSIESMSYKPFRDLLLNTICRKEAFDFYPDKNCILDDVINKLGNSNESENLQILANNGFDMHGLKKCHKYFEESVDKYLDSKEENYDNQSIENHFVA
ncbi:Fic family protein [Rickettsiales endosymbiont of Trichoplax sp. H2]|uniref:Fic family protein n=1 Tax=Rickettsiales endosymbiont of Trichoplax sp. H2 TaxID=2021221 RepID=UPI0012B38984|nr:Fic family protein [Rickettsiales endosymbiont of Trichoplax sp. H2]MSO14322.1 hypothetical protein [Rickettsiales endosymbiont of Trichoplax sp. H2]